MPSSFKQKKTKMTTPWLTNAMKSIGSSGVSEIAKLFPNLSDFTTTGINTIRSVQSGSGGKSGITNAVMSNKYVKAAKTAIKNIEEDLKTGNFNNDSRLASSYLGGGSDSSSDEDHGFSFGDGFDNEDDSSTSDSTLIESNFMISDQIGKQTKAQMKTSKANLEAMASIASATIAQTQSLGTGIIDQLTNVNNNLNTLITYNNENFSKYIEASISFYEKVGSSLTKGNKERSYDDKITPYDLLKSSKSGGLNLNKYIKFVKQNMNSGEASMINSMLDENSLQMLVANPLGLASGMIISKLMPTVIKETASGIEKSFSTFIPAMLTHMSAWVDDKSTGMMSYIKRWIGKNLGVKLEDTTSINRGTSIVKGAVEFDGITRHTIVELIPKELRRQTEYLRAISGGKKIDYNENIDSRLKGYDFVNGKEITTKEIDDNIITQITKSVSSNIRSGEFGEALQKAVDAVSNPQQQQKLNDTLDRLMVLLSQNNIENLSSKNKGFIDILNQVSDDRQLKKYISGIMDNLDVIAQMDYRGRGRIAGQTAKQNAIKNMTDNADMYGLFQSSLNFDDINSEIGKYLQASVNRERKHLPSLGDREGMGLPLQQVQFKQKFKTKGKTATDFKSKSAKRKKKGYSPEDGEDILTQMSDNIRSAGNHFQGALVSLLNKSPEMAFQHIFTVFKDSGSHLLKMVDDGFVKPLRDQLFGDDATKKQGLFSGFTNAISDLGKDAKYIVTGSEYVDSKGNRHEATDNCIFGDLSKTLTDIHEGILSKFFGDGKDFSPENKDDEPGVVNSLVDSFKQGIAGWKKSLFGGDGDNDEEIQQRFNAFKKYTKDNIPHALAGGIKGGVVGIASGGLLGSLLGGPIGGVLVGTAIGFAKRSQGFQELVFGKETEDGTHIGGLINDNMRIWINKNRHALIGGAALGVVKNAIFGSKVGVLGSLVGGPIAGALMGVATTTALRSRAFHDFVFGNEAEGQRGILQITTDAWKKIPGLNRKNKDNSESSKILGMTALGAGGGFLSGALIAKVGLLPAALSPMGPIGGAILGISGALLSQKNNIHDWLFGRKDKDEYGQKKNPGVLGQFGNLLQAYIFRPASRGIENMVEDASIWFKHDVLFDAKVIFERTLTPVIESTAAIVKNITKRFDDVKAYISKTFIKPFFSVIQKAVLKPINKITTMVAHVAMHSLKATISGPMKIAAFLLKPVGSILTHVSKRLGSIVDKFFGITNAFFWLGNKIKGAGKGVLNFVTAPLQLAGALASIGTKKLEDRRKNRYIDYINDHRGTGNDLRTEIGLNRRMRYLKKADLKAKREKDKEKSKNEQQIARYTNGMKFEDTAENRRHAEVLAGKKLKWKGDPTALPKIKKDSDLMKENPDNQTIEERDHVILSNIEKHVQDIANKTTTEKESTKPQSKDKDESVTKEANKSSENKVDEPKDEFEEARRAIRETLDTRDAKLADHRGGDYGDLGDVFESGMNKYGVGRYLRNILTPSYIKEKYNSATYLGGLMSAISNPRHDATEHNEHSLDGLTFDQIRELNKRYTQSDYNNNNGGQGTGHPYYSQNDPRWKNRPYGGYGPTMGTSGCGPVALAMALSEVTGRSISPTELADFAMGSGTRDESGTNWNFISKASNQYGVKSRQQIFPTNQYITSALDNGPVVLSGKEGGYGIASTLLGLGGHALLSLGSGVVSLLGKGVGGLINGVSSLGNKSISNVYHQDPIVDNRISSTESNEKESKEENNSNEPESKKAYLKAREKGYTAEEKHKQAEEEREKKNNAIRTRLAAASYKVQNGIKTGISSAFGNKGFITLALLGITNLFMKNWDGIKNVFGTLGEAGSYLLSELPSFIPTAISGISTIASGIADTVGPALTTIGSGVKAIAKWAGINFDGLGDAAGDTLQKTAEDFKFGIDNLKDNKSGVEILKKDANRLFNASIPFSLAGLTDEDGNLDQLGKDILYYKFKKNKKKVKKNKLYKKVSSNLSSKIADEQAKRVGKKEISKATSTGLSEATSNIYGSFVDNSIKEATSEGIENGAKLAGNEVGESVLSNAQQQLVKDVGESLGDEIVDTGTAKLSTEVGESVTGKVSGELMNSALSKNKKDKPKIITKLIEYLKKAVSFITEKLGMKSAGKLSGFIEKISSFIKKKADSLITKIAKVIGGSAVLSALTGGVGLILSDGGQAIIHGLDGLTGAGRLFRINKKYVTPLMRTISAGFSALLATTAGSVFQIIADVYESSTGSSLLTEFAYLLYNWLAKDEDVEKLEEGQQDFKDEYSQYKAEEIQKQYQAYLTSQGLTESEYTLDDFMADADDGKVTIKYKGFTEYNNSEHKSALNTAGDAIVGGAKAAGKGIHNGFDYVGKNIFGGTEAETYYDDNTGITYIRKNNDTYKMYDEDKNSLGEINAANINTSSMRNMTLKRKNALAASWSIITGGSEFEYVDPESASGKQQEASVVQQDNSDLQSENILSALSWKTVENGDDVYDDTTVWYTSDGCYYIRNKDGNYDKCNINGSIINGQTLTANEFELLKSSNLLIAGKAADNKSAQLAVDSIISANESYWSDAEKTIRKNASTYKKASSKNNKGVSAVNLNSIKKASSNRSKLFSGSGRSFGGFGDNLNGHSYYSQNDSRWSNVPYETIGSGGCGPAAMAMAMEDMTGKDINPIDMASFAQAIGDRDETGTNWNFISDAAGAYGIGTNQIITPSKNQLSSALNTGKPVVLYGTSGGYGRSPYTPAGHYVVAVGKDNNGNVIINDPRGRSYSGKYNLADVARETGSAWSFGGYGNKKGGRGVLEKIGNFITNLGSKAFEGMVTGKFDTNFDSWGTSTASSTTTTSNTTNSSTAQTATTGTFSKLVMFGDSRTHGMAIAKGASGNGDVYTAGNNIFIAKDGMGYDWFRSTAIDLGKQYIDSSTAVVVWFGVNDLDNVAKYAALVNSFPTAYGCKVYYMSVTPCDLTAKADFNNSIKVFNSTLKSSLLSSVTYIDSYGYVEGKMSSGEYTSPDKLHYNNTTYNGIYDYMMSKIGSISGGGSGLHKLRNKFKSIKQKFRGGGFGESLNGFSYYSQNDPTWKNVDYSGDMNDGATIGDTGCGPVAMSMVASQINGRDITPTELSRYAIESGNRDNTGTNWNFISNAANAYGINSTRLTPNVNTIDNEIDKGNPVILSGTSDGSGRSAYTTAGHYVVAVGRDNAGNIIINDPRGKSYSGKYNENKLLRQTGSAWSFGRGASGPTSTTGTATTSSRKPAAAASKSTSKKKKASIFDKLAKRSTSDTTTDTNKPLTKEEQAREAVVGWLLCIVGQNQYSMGSDRTLVGNGVDGHGVGDCSATQAWAYKQGTGLDIGGYTGAQISNSNGEIVKTFPMNSGACPSESDLLPGDLLFFGSGEAGGNSHVEMYVGNNTLIGHGSGTGPQVKVMTDYAPNSHGGCTYVIRYINSKTINTITVNQPDSSKFKVPNTFTNGRGYSGNGANVGGLSTGGSATTTSMSILDKISNVTSNFVSKAFEGLITGNFDTNFDSWGTSTASTTGASTSSNAVLSSGTLSGNTDAEKVKNYFKSQGLTDAGVAGLMGNLEAESGVRFNNLENQCEAGGAYDVGGYNDETYTAAVDNGTITKEQFLHPLPGKQFGYGLAQWTSPGRKEGLYDLVKSRNVSIADPQTQCDWLMNELNTSYQGVLNTLKTTNSLQEASDKVLVDFESPSNAWSQSSDRLRLSKNYYSGGSGSGRKNNSSHMRIKRYNINGGRGENTSQTDTINYTKIGNTGITRSVYTESKVPNNTTKIYNNYTTSGNTDELLKTVINVLKDISNNTLTTADKLDYLRQSASGSSYSSSSQVASSKSNGKILGSNTSTRNKMIASQIARG